MEQDLSKFHMFHVLQVKAALEIEVRTGVKFSNRGSILALARRCGYTTATKKIDALKDVTMLYELLKEDRRREEFNGHA
jgi:hypothetical protein